MATYDDLVTKQHQIDEEIQRIIRNFKKDGPERRSTSEYFHERIRKLEKAWAQFEQNDNEIRTLKNLPLDHAYFKDEHYNKVMNLITEYQDQFDKELLAIEAKKSASENKEDKHYSSQNVKGIIRKQQAVIASVNRLCNGLQDDESHSTQFYEIKIKTLNHLWQQIEELHFKIWELCEDPTALGYTASIYDETEDAVQEWLIKLAIQINERSVKNHKVDAGGNGNSLRVLQLPKIAIPKFNGDYLTWRQFFDLFSEMIHKQNIPNIQKMWYLKTNLTGEAEMLIRHLALTEENYESAWKTLQDRYNNVRVLTSTLVQKLVSQSSMTSSAASIKGLHDTTHECLQALGNLGVDTSSWDPLLLHILLNKLEKPMRILYEQSLKNPKELPTVKDFLSFIEGQFQSLEVIDHKGIQESMHGLKAKTTSAKPCILTGQRDEPMKCLHCRQSHGIYYCEKFLRLDKKQRYARAKDLNLCLNCLKKGHSFNSCKSRTCFKCNKKHNTLLHQDATVTSEAFPRFNSPSRVESNSSATSEFGSASKSTTTRASTSSINPSSLKSSQSDSSSRTNLAAETIDQGSGYVFLATAGVHVYDKDGQQIPCRVLLDSGAQMNLITDRLRRKLRLPDTKFTKPINGVGNTEVKIDPSINVITIKSRLNNYSTQVEVNTIREIASRHPQIHVNVDDWKIPAAMVLADPNFNTPQECDLLLGAEYYGELTRNGRYKLNENLPILQNTVLGWVVLGKVTSLNDNKRFCGVTNADLDKQLQQFWEMEEGPSAKIVRSSSDEKCEEFYKYTTVRNDEGRFVVNLPMLSDPQLLGRSKEIAFKRLLSIERKLLREIDYKEQYNNFLKEYRDMGHMEEMDPKDLAAPYCFLPHHFVLKPSSSTTKLRVVFDASAKTSNNLSLNDLLLKGPKIQDDLFAIILRFRMRRFVFTADIAKMYRQIIVASEDRNLQLIMWREHPSDPVKYFKLNTVTYGTKSAPYLAVRCLQELAQNGEESYPLGSAAIKDFYVDDVMTGSDNLEEAFEIQNQLKTLLKSAGFELRKWCGNHPKLVADIPKQDLEIQLNFSDLDKEHVKTLGLAWHPITDSFTITSAQRSFKEVTKRTILAEASQIFDPLGLVNPVVVMSKIFMQQLWKQKFDWDDELPFELQSAWLKFRKELGKLSNIKVSRHMFSDAETSVIQLHVFADASERAYGCALYLRSTDTTGAVTVRLLCSKSRVAPVKTTTIPRLELCAATLAAQVVDRVKNTIKLQLDEVFYWTDSSIVLSWIKGESSLLKTFVANRVATIQELTEKSSWRHVSTSENPADLVSRGLYPEELTKSQLWFNGPSFLKKSRSHWPKMSTEVIRLEVEEKQLKSILAATNAENQHPIWQIQHGNSFQRLLRITAYILRFINRLRKKNHANEQWLTARELEDATDEIVKAVQLEDFKDDIKLLQRTGQIAKSSKLATLAPFIDSKGILRVGGRLQAADIGYNSKHPSLLPANNFVTKLIMIDIHSSHLHAGPQALQAIARQKFWILQGRNIARSVVANCIRCAKIRPHLYQQQMGNLPTDRVKRARPFTNAGVDFCGPLYTHYKIRGKRPQKTYIAVWCCFATKAVHLEVVSDLTTEGFLGALKRFIARRGVCENIYSDNATNFVGARNQLEEVYEMMTSYKSKEKISSLCTTHRIQFHFIPPRSPHFGGLWEAAVKSTKTLLYRTLASASATYEELCTITAEAEAILNSRPLTPMSSDPNDLRALTPAHFIIGEPMTAAINTHNTDTKMSLLARWALVSYLREEFWKRWHEEYLEILQTRAKWTQCYPNIKAGTLVIIKDDNMPPLKWAMGRVIEPIIGSDGKARVADVKTATGIFRRAVHQLAPLPVENVSESNIDLNETSAVNPDDDKVRRDRKRKGTISATNQLKNGHHTSNTAKRPTTE